MVPPGPLPQGARPHARGAIHNRRGTRALEMRPPPDAAVTAPVPRHHRTIQDFEAAIVRAEMTRTRWVAWAEELEAAGRDSWLVRGLLDVAAQRLARLNRSREVLLADEAGHGKDGHA
jgi:hypothetical protein